MAEATATDWQEAQAAREERVRASWNRPDPDKAAREATLAEIAELGWKGTSRSWRPSATPR